MELKIFVAETLKQIVEGIVTAQQDLKERNVMVNPTATSKGADGVFRTASDSQVDGQKTVQMVEFEVVLGQTEGIEAGGRIGVFFSSVGVGAQEKSETGSSAVNKIKFSIPIVFPSQG